MNIYKKVAVAAVSFVAAGAAMADQGSDAITALQTTGTTYITAAFGVSILIAGGFWGIKMMKKAFSKAG